MVKRTGPTNPYLRELIDFLRRKSAEVNAPIWKAVAKKLERPTRQRIEVNLSRIERFAKENETIVVPGVVLGTGFLTKKLTVAAWRFSQSAKKKIEEAGGKPIGIKELVEENPKGSNVRIMG